jgi:glucose-1-phosphate thymidylyltransferase
MQGEPLGLAHAVGCARDFVGDDSFIVYFGDTILGDNITPTLVDSFEQAQSDAGVVLKHVDNPSRFGVVDFDDDEITQILEKPDDPPTSLAYVGVLAFTPSIFKYIEEQEPSWRAELELTQVLHNMVAGGSTVSWEIVEGVWKDVGTPDDVIETNKIMLDELEPNIKNDITSDAEIRGPIQVGEGSVIEDSATIEGPAIIGEGTVIRANAHIGPYTSIGDQCTIEDSHIVSSVVMKGTEIKGEQSIKESIIGKSVSIDDFDNSPSRRYIIGRDSILGDGK